MTLNNGAQNSKYKTVHVAYKTLLCIASHMETVFFLKVHFVAKQGATTGKRLSRKIFRAEVCGLVTDPAWKLCTSRTWLPPRQGDGKLPQKPNARIPQAFECVLLGTFQVGIPP